MASLIRSVRTARQLAPLSRLYCQLPRLVSSSPMTIASVAPSRSVMLPSTTRAATLMPAGLAAFSAIVAKAGEKPELRTGGLLMKKILRGMRRRPDSAGARLTEELTSGSRRGHPETAVAGGA